RVTIPSAASSTGRLMLRPRRSTGLIRALSLGGLARPSMVPIPTPRLGRPQQDWPDSSGTKKPAKSRFGAVFGSYLFRVPAEGKTSPHGAKILSERARRRPGGRASEGVRTLSLRRVIVT